MRMIIEHMIDEMFEMMRNENGVGLDLPFMSSPELIKLLTLNHAVVLILTTCCLKRRPS
jgi:hypothetical protein